MKELTKAEEQLMRILWKLEKAFLKDVVEACEEPKPAYTTVSTVLRVLVKKRFIGFNTYGKTHEYYPLVAKEAYFKEHIGGVINNFFDGSANKFASFFTDKEDMSIQQLEDMKQMLENKIQKLKESND